MVNAVERVKSVKRVLKKTREGLQYNIRTAVQQDATNIDKLIRVWKEETPVFRHVAYDPTVVQENFIAMLSARLWLVLVVELPKAKFTPLVGLFLGNLSASLLGRALFAKDAINFVLPAYRKLGIGADLLRVYVDWAKQNKAVYIGAGVSTGGAMVDNIDRVYEQAGFKRVGQIYAYKGE